MIIIYVYIYVCVCMGVCVCVCVLQPGVKYQLIIFKTNRNVIVQLELYSLAVSNYLNNEAIFLQRIIEL